MMMPDTREDSQAPLVVGLGEVLWDLLPAGRQLGGATANVAFHVAALGGRAAVASCVGNDELGREILDRLDAAGVDRTAVAVDSHHPTGTVPVVVDDRGNPTFTITEDVAWDYVPWTEACEALAVKADAVCFGSAAQRCVGTRETIARFLQAMPDQALRICDINLRPPFVDRDIIVASLEMADMVKLNDDELDVLRPMLSLPADVDAALRVIRERFDLRLIVLTCAAEGSVIVSEQALSRQTGQPVDVVDAVGAGDAFTAVVALGQLMKLPLEQTHAHAEQVARYVCTQPGATPPLPEAMRLT
jgi:fructokinase